MRRAGLLLRWSLRDLRQRWVLVTAIALVIAVGTGLSAGLASLERWRIESNDASFELLSVHDIRAQAADGTDVPQGALKRLVAGIPHAADVLAADERLILPTQVDASRGARTALATGRVVGVPVGAGLRVNGIAPVAGRALGPADSGRPVALLDRDFAARNDLPNAGTLRAGGLGEIRYVGLGQSPEYFYILAPAGGLGGQGTFAVLYMPLESAQRLAGRRGAVNDLVIRLRPGRDPAVVRREIRAAAARDLPSIGLTFSGRADIDAYRLLYEDAGGDQEMMNVISLLVLLGAALGAFNLISRVVQAQRREIGVGRAIGAPTGIVALRPFLFATEVAVLGAALGVAAGFGINLLLERALADLLPLPIVRTPFDVSRFARGAALGLILPLAAAAIPVWRGVRMTPVDAIRTGARARPGAGVHPLAGHIRAGGRTTARMPVRNVLRTPTRTALTTLGLGAVVAVVVSILGLLDSFSATIERSEREAVGTAPGRTLVTLAGFRGVDDAAVRAVSARPEVAGVVPELRLGATISSDHGTLDAVLTLLDADNGLWTPTIVAGRWSRGSDGVVLSQEAARDLRLRVGDPVRLRHPRRTGTTTFALVERTVPVVALHPDPIRVLAYMDRSQASTMGLGGIANALSVAPGATATSDDVTRALFGRPAIASVEGVTVGTDAVQESLGQATGLLRVAEAIMLLLAALIGFNSAGIGAEERTREHATMFAFGLPVRSVVRMAIVENALMGVIGTIIGTATGFAILRWIAGTIWPRVLPDLGIVTAVSAGSLATAAGVGVGAMALSPLLTVRRLRRLDVPGALRVVE